MDGTAFFRKFASETIEYIFYNVSFSVIGALYILDMPNGEELSDLEKFIKKFSYTAPLRCFFSYEIFRVKFEPSILERVPNKWFFLDYSYSLRSSLLVAKGVCKSCWQDLARALRELRAN